MTMAKQIRLTDKEYLDRALDLIVELTEDDASKICDKLHDIPEENAFCASNCGMYDRFCLLRYLKYYNGKETKDGI